MCFVKKYFLAFVYIFFIYSVIYAQNHSDDLVYNLPGLESENEVQFAGYISLTEQKELFYWFCGQKDYENKCTLLWSNGGPGSSSLWGFFLENGPFIISDDGVNLKKREKAWSDYFNYLIFDHPVGVGLSFAAKENISKTVEEGVDELYKALLLFFEKHPELVKNPLILAGQSYAGTYLPLLLERILEGEKKNQHKIRVPLLILASPWIDPYVQMDKDSEYAYTHGFISLDQKQELDSLYKDKLLPSIGLEIKRLTQLYMENFEIAQGPSFEPIFTYLNRQEVRKALHIPKNEPLISSFSKDVDSNYSSGVNQSYNYLVQQFLDKNKVKILIISGLNDAKDTQFLGVEKWLYNLKGDKASEFQLAPLKPWKDVSGLQVLGFEQKSRYISWLKVLRAGHLAVLDQPLIIDYIVSNFANELSH